MGGVILFVFTSLLVAYVVYTIVVYVLMHHFTSCGSNDALDYIELTGWSKRSPAFPSILCNFAEGPVDCTKEEGEEGQEEGY